MSSRRRPIVLIVDDCDCVRAVLKVVLREMAGIRAVGAATSEEALKLARRRNFDVVISDIVRPGMDGLAFLEVFKRAHLSLMLATRGGPGPQMPPTGYDREQRRAGGGGLLSGDGLAEPGQLDGNLGDGGPPKSFVRAFGPQSTNLAVWKVIGHEVSPIYSAARTCRPF